MISKVQRVRGVASIQMITVLPIDGVHASLLCFFSNVLYVGSMLVFCNHLVFMMFNLPMFALPNRYLISNVCL